MTWWPSSLYSDEWVSDAAAVIMATEAGTDALSVLMTATPDVDCPGTL